MGDSILDEFDENSKLRRDTKNKREGNDESINIKQDDFMPKKKPHTHSKSDGHDHKHDDIEREVKTDLLSLTS